MNILFWLNIGFDQRTPQEHLLTDVMRSLHSGGHEICILQKDNGGSRPALPEALCGCIADNHCIKVRKVKKSDFRNRYLSDLKYIIDCRKYIAKNRKFDCVFVESSNVSGFQLSLLKWLMPNVRIVFNAQDIFPQNAAYVHKLNENGFLCRVLTKIQKRAYHIASEIIAISEDVVDQLVELGISCKKISMIYNWSYQDKVYEHASLDYSSVKPYFCGDTFNVVYAGNVGLVQNVEVLLRVADRMREMQDIRFSVFGDGVYKDHLQELAQAQNLKNVSFYPMLDEADAPALYASADVNLIPLAEKIYRTALPSKTATCLACGQPVILSIGTESAFARRLHEETGVPITDSNDVEAIAEAIRRIKTGALRPHTKEFFETHCARTTNSRQYAAIITGAGE